MKVTFQGLNTTNLHLFTSIIIFFFVCVFLNKALKGFYNLYPTSSADKIGGIFIRKPVTQRGFNGPFKSYLLKGTEVWAWLEAGRDTPSSFAMPHVHSRIPEQ
ncbi:hypothetical protein FKM82_019203 [Ascaphus truei]